MEKIKTDNPNSSFFDGYYKEIWKQVFPIETTLKEVDYIMTECNLQKGNRVLDIMCGHGRHVLELARRGINVTAVDNLPDYISEIEEIKAKEKLPVDCLLTDVLEMKLTQQYNAAICMGNSLQFFNRDDLFRLLAGIHKALKPASKFIINTWSIAEIVFRNFKDSSSGKMGDMSFSTESRIFFQPARMEVESIITDEKGEEEKKKGIDYIYSLNELELIFNQAGFLLKEVYSIPGKKKFTLGEPRAYIVAEASSRKG